MSRAALPNKHPLSKRVVGASSTQAPEAALPPSPRRDPARGRAGVGGRERGTAERSAARAATSAHEQPRNAGWLWDGGRGEQSLVPCPPRCPRPGPGGSAGAMPAPLSPTAGPPARAGGAGAAGWAGTCRGRRGRRGSRGQSRSARPWPWHGARWGQRGAARSPQPHAGCNQCSARTGFKEGAQNPLPPSRSPPFQLPPFPPGHAQPVFPAWLKEGWLQPSSPPGWELGDEGGAVFWE